MQTPPGSCGRFLHPAYPPRKPFFVFMCKTTGNRIITGHNTIINFIYTTLKGTTHFISSVYINKAFKCGGNGTENASKITFNDFAVFLFGDSPLTIRMFQVCSWLFFLLLERSLLTLLATLLEYLLATASSMV